MQRSINVLITNVAICALLAGCVVGPAYHKPEVALPEQWISSKGNDANAALQQEWWTQFHNPVLEQLIAKALSDNIDLKIAEARIAQSRANRNISRADIFPTGNVAGSGERQGNRLAFPGQGMDLTKPFNAFQTGFDVTWELDVFGGKRRALESATASLQEAEAQRDEARISLLAEVALTYAEIREYQNQLAITRDTVASDQNTLKIANERYHAGFDARIDVTRAEAELDQTQSQLPYYQNLLSQAEYRMDVLLAALPGAAHALVSAEGELPMAEHELVLSAPAAVIAHRPDVRAAEQHLIAATAEQGVAIAKLFPDISLSGFFGLLNTDSSQLLHAASKSWSVGGNVLWPLLSYGKLSAGVDAMNAMQQEALLSYQKAIIHALSDVERALTSYAREDEHRKALEKVVADNLHAVDITQQRYKEGMSTFMDVLDAKRTLYASQGALVTAKAQTSRNLISVYKSLGGGWEVPEKAASVAAKP